jgi:hypothetical protein
VGRRLVEERVPRGPAGGKGIDLDGSCDGKAKPVGVDVVDEVGDRELVLAGRV